MTEGMLQGTLFDDDDFVAVPRNANQWAYRLAKLQEELRVGQGDYERLIVDQSTYERVVANHRGKTVFTSKQVEYAAMEARSIVRFLKRWNDRAGELNAQIEHCESEIRKLV